MILAKSVPIFFEVIGASNAARDIDPTALSVCMRVDRSETSYTAFDTMVLLEYSHLKYTANYIEAWLVSDGARTLTGNLYRIKQYQTSAPLFLPPLRQSCGSPLERAPLICGAVMVRWMAREIVVMYVTDEACITGCEKNRPITVIAISGSHDADVVSRHFASCASW